MISKLGKDSLATLQHIIQGTHNGELTVEERNAIIAIIDEYKSEVERCDDYFKYLWLVCNEFPGGQLSIHRSSIDAYKYRASPALSISSGEAVDGAVITAFNSTEVEDEIS